MRSPTCESVVDDEDLRDREQSTLLRDSNPKSDPPPPHYKNKKPPSVHSDSGYSSKTGLTSGSAGSRPSAGARPSAKSQHRSNSRPPPSGALARVKSAHTAAPSSHPPALPPGSALAYSQSLPPRPASAAPHDQRFTLPNRPPAAPTTRPQQHPPPPPPVQTHPAYYPSYHHHQQQQQQQQPPPSPAHQFPPQHVSPAYPSSAGYSPGVAMPAAPPPSSYQYQQPPLPPPPQPPYPQRPPQRTSSMSQRRPSSIAVPNGFPFPGGVPTPSSGYGVASPGPSVHTPISPSTPTVYTTSEGTYTWEGPGPPPSLPPGRPIPPRRTSVSTSRPTSWYEPLSGGLGPTTVVADHSRRRSVHLSHDAMEHYRDPLEDARRMPPPASRPPSTRPPQQTIDMAYRGGPPPRPQVGRKSKSTTYHPSAGEPVPEVTRERPRQYSDGNVPQTASRKLQKNTQNAEAYMQEQAGKTSLQLTDDELNKRRLKDAPPARTTSKSHRSRAPSQSTSRSVTESERERQAMRVSIDNSGVSISGDTEGRALDISMGEDGQHCVTIGSPSKSRQKRYITDGSTQSRASKQSFAERSRKRDSVVDAGDVDNAQAVVRTDSSRA